jgi:hypothetical protein
MKPYLVTLEATICERIIVSVNAPDSDKAQDRADKIIDKMRIKDEELTLDKHEKIKRDKQSRKLVEYTIIGIDEVE